MTINKNGKYCIIFFSRESITTMVKKFKKTK